MGRAFFFSLARINARDGERKRIILATLFRRPTRFRSFSHSVRGTLERREIRSFGFDTRANWIPVFDSFASRCPENYARTTIDSFFELHTHSFPSSSSEIFHLPRLRTSGYIGFFESFPRIAILSRCLDVLWKLFFLCDRSLADGANNGSTPHPLTRQASKIENTGIRRRKRAW